MTIVLTTGCYLNTSSVVHFRSSPLFIPVPFSEPFPCPFNTVDFGHSTARRFAGCPCRPPAKVHPFSGTPSSFIQHVYELSSFLNLSSTSGHTYRLPHMVWRNRNLIRNILVREQQLNDSCKGNKLGERDKFFLRSFFCKVNQTAFHLR